MDDNGFIIKKDKVIGKNKVYDIDRLFWNGGKLFGHEVRYRQYFEKGGYIRETGPYINAKHGGRDYDILVCFNWGSNCVELSCNAYNPYICEPVYAKVIVPFNVLFLIKEELVKEVVDSNIETLLKSIETLKNDGKKDNRNS